MPERREVFNAIEIERCYQERRWSEETTTTKGIHTVPEYLVFMQHYLGKAIQDVSTNGEPKASQLALDNVRKIAALAVACMEQNGVIRRTNFEVPNEKSV